MSDKISGKYADRKHALAGYKRLITLLTAALFGLALICFFTVYMPDLTLSKIDDGYTKVAQYGAGSLTESEISSMKRAHSFSLYLFGGQRENLDWLIDHLIDANDGKFSLELSSSMSSTQHNGSLLFLCFLVLAAASSALLHVIDNEPTKAQV